jgi:P-type Ca2+ transporter type 2C
VVALIFVDRSVSSSIITAITRPNRALAIALPIVGALLAITVFWAPARTLFRFGPLDAQWLVVPFGAGIGVTVVLELLKPIWRKVSGSGGKTPTRRPMHANPQVG